MNQREAKRKVCGAVSALLQGDQPNEFLYVDKDGNDLPAADSRRMRLALDDLAQELFERGCGPMATDDDQQEPDHG